MLAISGCLPDAFQGRALKHSTTASSKHPHLTRIGAPDIFQLLPRRRNSALQLLRSALAHLPPEVSILVLLLWVGGGAQQRCSM